MSYNKRRTPAISGFCQINVDYVPNDDSIATRFTEPGQLKSMLAGDLTQPLFLTWSGLKNDARRCLAEERGIQSIIRRDHIVNLETSADVTGDTHLCQGDG